MSTHTHIHKSTCHIVWLLLMLCAQMTHYPPRTALGLYESDPLIDLYGLLSLVDFFGCLLLASPSTHTYIRADRLCATTAILSQPMHHQHHCTHARVTKQLFAELAQGSCDYSRPEIPIGGEVQLVGIALITTNQRDRHTLVPQATITNNAIHCTFRLSLLSLL